MRKKKENEKRKNKNKKEQEQEKWKGTHLDVEDVPVRARAPEVGQERRAVRDERAHGAEPLRRALALVVDARVREHVVDPEELRVRAGRRAQKLQEPTIELALRVKL